MVLLVRQTSSEPILNLDTTTESIHEIDLPFVQLGDTTKFDIDSADLDNVCDTDNSTLFRWAGIWGCGEFNMSDFVVTIINENHTYIEINKSRYWGNLETPADITTEDITIKNLIPSLNNTYSLGNSTNIWKEMYVGSNSLHIGNTKISYATGDDDGLMFNGSIHLESLNGVAGNIALHEGTEPTTCVSGDGGRLWYNLTNELMWQDKNSVSKKVLLEGDAINTDKIISPDSLKNLTITNTTLIYNDGTVDRIVSNPSVSKIISPNGQNVIKSTDTNMQMTFNDYIRLNINSGTAYIRSNDGTNKIVVKGGSIAILENNKERVWVDNLFTELYSPSRLNYLRVYNSGLLFEYNNTDRLNINNSGAYINGNFTVGNERIFVDEMYVALQSPAQNHYLSVDNTGAFYDGSEILTVSNQPDIDKIVSPDTLKDLAVSNINLLYSDGNYARLYIDDTESRLTSPDGQSKSQVKDGDFNFYDGTRDRIEADGIGTTLRSTTGAYVSLLSNDFLFSDNTRSRIIVSDVESRLASPDGTNALIMSDASAYITSALEITGNTAITGAMTITSSGAAITSIDSNNGVGLSVKQSSANKPTIIDFYEEGATRKGWFGYGSSGYRHNMYIFNDYTDGNIILIPRDNIQAGEVDVIGEFSVTGVAGSGKVVCVKADGNFGVCSSATSGSGTCTCG